MKLIKISLFFVLLGNLVIQPKGSKQEEYYGIWPTKSFNEGEGWPHKRCMISLLPYVVPFCAMTMYDVYTLNKKTKSPAGPWGRVCCSPFARAVATGLGISGLAAGILDFSDWNRHKKEWLQLQKKNK